MPDVLSGMERDGIKIDPHMLSRLSGDFAQRMLQFEAEAYKLAGREFNMGSPKQLGEILFDEMKLPGGSKTKTGAWSTDASILEDLADAGHELPRKLLDWRQLSKLRSTYTEALREAVNPQTKRVHTTYALAVHAQRAGSPPTIPTCRTSRSAPKRAAASAKRSSRSRAMCWSRPTIRRSNCGCWRTSPTFRN